MQVTTAVIFAAGFGSRMLPVTAAVQKELLPILDRPIIDYVVADCVAAGIKRIIFVVSQGSHGLQDYYLGNPALDHYLKRFNKTEAQAKIQAARSQATFEFIEQPDNGSYGTAVPVLLAAPYLPSGEAFLACGGDDFIWHADGQSELAKLITTFTSANAKAALMALKRPTKELHRYGVLGVEHRGEHTYLRELVEKPEPGQAPSNLINISKYIFTPTLLDYIARIKPDPKLGELLIVDALRAAAADHPIAIHPAGGRFLDAGNVAGWLEANRVVAQSRPELQ